MEERELRGLLLKVLEADDPRERLAALAELRRDLDALETELAADALHAGFSWSQVGAALGISKQAAHRRHSHDLALLDRAAETEHQGRRAIVSAEARQAVRMARHEAVSMGHASVGTEHLLLGLLQCGDTATSALLDRLGVTLALAREAAEPTVEMTAAAVAGAAQPPRRDSPAAVLSPLARRVVERALRDRAAASETLSALDLLSALMADDNGGAARTLKTLGVDAHRVSAEMARSLTSPAAP